MGSASVGPFSLESRIGIRWVGKEKERSLLQFRERRCSGLIAARGAIGAIARRSGNNWSQTFFFCPHPEALSLLTA